MTRDARPLISRTQRALSPAVGFVLVFVLILFVALSVGMFVADVSEDLDPDATFNWTTADEDGSTAVTIEHVAGDDIDGANLRLDADSQGSLNGSATFADWGTVSNGTAFTVGSVADAVIENGSVVATDDEWNASEAGHLDDRNASFLDPDVEYDPDENVTVDGENVTVTEHREALRDELATDGVFVGDDVVALAPAGANRTDGGTVVVHDDGEDVSVDDLRTFTLVWDPFAVSADLDEYDIER